jgi:hypothetical protein
MRRQSVCSTTYKSVTKTQCVTNSESLAGFTQLGNIGCSQFTTFFLVGAFTYYISHVTALTDVIVTWK